MDREQEQLQSLGFFGTIKESFKILFSWKKIFTHITLTLILPLSIFYLVQIEISDLISSKVSNTSNNTITTTSHRRSTDSIFLGIFKFVDLVFYLILYLLSTAAVVYTVACFYAAKQTTYKKVMKIVPKVWKRLLVTFLWSVAISFVYHVVALGVFALWIFLLANTVAGLVVGVVILILYLVGLVYIIVIWQLACVVSVLEEKYGLKAMKKSRVLIKGKMGVAVLTLILFGFCFGGIDVLFERYVVVEWSRNVLISIFVAIGCVVLLVPVTLLSLVVETIIYFVCKSYHHENIDKSSLSDHLEEYLGDYVRLNRSKDVQLEQQQPDSRV
ncbi:hypothetical protein Ddye_009255 [Dipteronia dyeriana]|uniref:Uncharacterized protein n=1 Tax=Dipteronia dyeriana TaxID=168575 RepID=A0AAE0CMQ3_9ROSI|nr:hypothetical protein Ddye_009255 [Dipteronia dyeriana]